ncbi:MAG TPA: twin-arginine translocase subunit TatC [Nocardioidaceae bacterium]|jgi:sec-independent protein translocase protein TatC|nr:twin-arginine translocase subunit TatC [Nocardioidaceae bacterium]
MPLRDHLRELRNRLFKAGLALLAGSVAGWFLYDPVLEALARPLFELQQAGNRNIMPNLGGVTQAFDLKIKISIFIGAIVSSPLWIYQLWAFITPGLTRKERRYALGFLAAAVPLFLAGAWLAYLFVPNAVRFLVGFTPEGYANFLSVPEYLGFVMRIILAFGVSFLVPVVLVALNMIGLLRGRTILKAWRWVVVVAFTFAAMATPTPDVLSMFLLALPLLALFAIAIAITMLNDRRRERLATAFDDLDDDTASPL